MVARMSSSAVGAMWRSRRPGRWADPTLSRRISATWLRVSGTLGANSDRNATAADEFRIRVGRGAAELVAEVAAARRTPEDPGDRLADIFDVNRLQPRPAPAEKGINW